MADEVKLLGLWASPFSRRIEIALKLKGIPYEYIEQDLSNKSPLLLKSNPVHKKVPVLIHNGKSIVESLVILEYIDETWKQNPILPADPYERATARFWAKFIDEKSFPAAWKALLGEDQEKSVEEVLESLKILENELKDKKFFGGEEFGYVDIVGNIVAYWIGLFQEVTGLEMLTAENFPALFKWSERYVEVPAFKKNLPPREKAVALFKEKVFHTTGILLMWYSRPIKN